MAHRTQFGVAGSAKCKQSKTENVCYPFYSVIKMKKDIFFELSRHNRKKKSFGLKCLPQNYIVHL